MNKKKEKNLLSTNFNFFLKIYKEINDLAAIFDDVSMSISSTVFLNMIVWKLPKRCQLFKNLVENKAAKNRQPIIDIFERVFKMQHSLQSGSPNNS